MLPLHPMELFTGRVIIASVFGGFKGKTQLPNFAKECMQGVSSSLWSMIVNGSFFFMIITLILTFVLWGQFQVVNLEEFITHELPFEKINEAFQLLIDGKSVRCLLHL